MTDEVTQFRNFNQQYQLVVSQKQRHNMQVAEIDSALKELENASGKVYMGIGTLMIEQTKDYAKKKLKEQEKEIKERVDILDKQENTIRKKLEELQKKIQEKQE